MVVSLFGARLHDIRHGRGMQGLVATGAGSSVLCALHAIASAVWGAALAAHNTVVFATFETG